MHFFTCVHFYYQAHLAELMLVLTPCGRKYVVQEGERLVTTGGGGGGGGGGRWGGGVADELQLRGRFMYRCPFFFPRHLGDDILTMHQS